MTKADKTDEAKLAAVEQAEAEVGTEPKEKKSLLSAQEQAFWKALKDSNVTLEGTINRFQQEWLGALFFFRFKKGGGEWSKPFMTAWNPDGTTFEFVLKTVKEAK